MHLIQEVEEVSIIINIVLEGVELPRYWEQESARGSAQTWEARFWLQQLKEDPRHGCNIGHSLFRVSNSIYHPEAFSIGPSYAQAKQRQHTADGLHKWTHVTLSTYTESEYF